MSGKQPPRMLRRPRPGPLRQPPDHPPRRGRSARAQGAAGEAAAPGTVRRVLRGVHARDEPASNGAPRQPVSRRARDRAHRGRGARSWSRCDRWTASPASEVKDEMNANAARREELKAKLAAADEPPPLLHPEMAELYRQKVTTLAQALEQPETRTEATEALRGLDRRHRPDARPSGDAQNRTEGNLAAMLGADRTKRRGRRKPATSRCKLKWLRGRDLNPRPLGYEPNELPDCSTPRQPTNRNTPCGCAQGSHRRQEPGTIQQQLDSRRFVIRQASTARRTRRIVAWTASQSSRATSGATYPSFSPATVTAMACGR